MTIYLNSVLLFDFMHTKVYTSKNSYENSWGIKNMELNKNIKGELEIMLRV